MWLFICDQQTYYPSIKSSRIKKNWCAAHSSLSGVWVFSLFSSFFWQQLCNNSLDSFDCWLISSLFNRPVLRNVRGSLLLLDVNAPPEHQFFEDGRLGTLLMRADAFRVILINYNNNNNKLFCCHDLSKLLYTSAYINRVPSLPSSVGSLQYCSY